MATEKRLIYLDEAIAKVKDDGVLGEGYSDDERIDDVIDILESCHTVDAVEVVHGDWRFCGSDKYNDAYECSVCGKMAMDDSNYCPNCGAKNGRR